MKRCLFKYIKLCTRKKPDVQKKDRREGTYVSGQYASIIPGTTKKTKKLEENRLKLQNINHYGEKRGKSSPLSKTD